MHRAVEIRELDGGDRSPARRPPPTLARRGRSRPAAGSWSTRANSHPLDMADDGEVHILTSSRREYVSGDGRSDDPAFETFYEAHRDEVYGFLRRRLGRHRPRMPSRRLSAGPQGLPALEHGDHLRAWVFTIASRIVDRRRPRAKARRASSRSSRREDGRARVRGSRAADRRPAAEGAGGRRAALRLRPRLRRDRRRARLQRGRGAPGRLRRSPAATKEERQ